MATNTALPKDKSKKEEEGKGLILGRPVKAFVTFIVVLVGAILLLAYPFTLGEVDAAGVILFLLGLGMLIFSYYAFKVEYWSWGSVLIFLVFVLLIAVPTLSYVLIAYGVALIVVLFFVRRTYGVGVWKIEKAKEEEEKKARDAVRMANTEGLHCPKCKSTDLYICDDGSTICRTCQVGFVDIRNASVKPKSSMQF